MNDPRLEKLARLLVNYSVGVKELDKVVISGDALAEALLKAIYAEVLKAGGLPLLNVSLNGINEIFYRHASKEQLCHVPPPQRLIVETYDAQISIIAEENTRALSNVDPQKMVLHSRSRRDLMKIHMERSARKEFRWVLGLFPTPAYAQDAEMGLAEYEDFAYGACLPDPEDPIGYWQRFSRWQDKIIDWLKGRKEVHIKGKETDLTLSIEGRPFINCDGHENMPDGEVFTGPVENSINGQVYFSYPAIESGREVSGIRLQFKDGLVVKATAEKNEEFLLKTLDTDDGSRRVGEFAIGTNSAINHFTRQILFDEKIGGTFHMALGAGYPESGSKNESSIHWDMISSLKDGGEIRVDSELLYKDGNFVINLE